MRADLTMFLAGMILAALFNAAAAVVGEQIRDRAAQHEDNRDE